MAQPPNRIITFKNNNYFVELAHVPKPGGKITEEQVLFHRRTNSERHPMGIFTRILSDKQSPTRGHFAINVSTNDCSKPKRVEYYKLPDADLEAIITFKKQLPEIKRIDRRAP